MQPKGLLKDQKRRRYERRPINVRATLHSESFPHSDCEIRDFCEGGLYLVFDEPVDPSKILSEPLPEILVQFAATLKGKNETIQIKVSPVRVTTSGIGVSFVHPSTKVIQALQCLAVSQHETAHADRVICQASDAVKEQIKAKFEDAVQNAIKAILSEFFGTLEPGLREAAEFAGSNYLSNCYLDANTTLQENRSHFEQSYNQTFLAQLYSNDTYCTKNWKSFNGKYSLSLVDKDDFEDWLILADITNKISSLHENVLSGLDKRIAALHNQSARKNYNPVSPTVFCEAFRTELDEFEMDCLARRQIYKIFGNCLEHRLEGLYSGLKQYLEPIKLPADNFPTPEVKQLSQPAARTNSRKRKTTGLIDSFKRFNQISDSTDAIHPEIIQQSTAPDNRDVPTSISECSTREILTALRKLAGTHDADHEPITSGDKLESEILRELASPLTDPASSSTDDPIYIELAAKLYETLTEQSANLNIADSILDKLRIPLLNLAAREPDFLNDPSHTAWPILDMVGRLNGPLSGYDDSKDNEIRQALDTIIGEFSTNYDADQTIFESIRNDLQNLLTPLEVTKVRTVERVRENCAGKHQIEKAKATVQKLIDDRIAGKPVPQVILSLLNSGWEHLLILSMLRGGADSALFRSRLEIFDRLLHLLAEPVKLDAVPTTDLHHLANRIDENLSFACSDLFQHKTIMNEIVAHLLGLGQPPVRTEPVMTVAAARSSSRVDSDNLSKDLRGFAKRAKGLNVGDWLMFNLHNMERGPLKLVWKGEDPWLFVFVNRQGQSVTELPLRSLATFLKHGLVWKIENMDDPLSERTFSAMLQNMHEKLIRRNTVDDRTGLINRKGFLKQLKQEFAALKNEKPGHYLCYLEIDQIRWISKICDVDAVDAVLKMIIHQVRFTLGKDDLFGQMGDQLFGILYKSVSADRAAKICENLRRAITGLTFDWKEHSFPLGVSIGLTRFVRQSQGLPGILAHADGACMAAKNAGNNEFQIYDEHADGFKTQDEVCQWVGHISNVIDQNRLFTRAQLIAPVTPTQNDHRHYEILLGIKDESGNFIPPQNFISAAEYCGRISEIDRWVVQHVFEWIESNPDKMETISGFSINLSGCSVVSNDFLEFTRQQLTSRNVNPEKITFEVTETAAVSNLSSAQKFISQIKCYGCKFSLDDFGSGFSSYAYLKNLDVDYLKIDGVFVKDLAHNATDYAMVKSMNEIGHSLNMETIAEYVEDEAILEKVKEIGVDYAQGYGIGKPVLLADL